MPQSSLSVRLWSAPDAEGRGPADSATMSPLEVPAEPDFRAEVARLRSGERRRWFPAHLHVGVPAGEQRRLAMPWPVPAEYDAGLRFDVADALVEALLDDSGIRSVWVWLTRPGVPEVHDRDLEWLSAAHRAVEGHGLQLAGFRAVTRTGWLDVVSGRRRTWKRLRD